MPLTDFQSLVITGGHVVRVNETAFFYAVRDYITGYSYYSFSLIEYDPAVNHFIFHYLADPQHTHPPMLAFFDMIYEHDSGRTYRIGGASTEPDFDEIAVFTPVYYNGTMIPQNATKSLPIVSGPFVDVMAKSRFVPTYYLGMATFCTIHHIRTYGLSLDRSDSFAVFRPEVIGIYFDSGCEAVEYQWSPVPCNATFTMTIVVENVPESPAFALYDTSISLYIGSSFVVRISDNTLQIFWDLTGDLAGVSKPVIPLSLAVFGCFEILEKWDDIIEVSVVPPLEIVPDTLAFYLSPPGPYPLEVTANTKIEFQIDMEGFDIFGANVSVVFGPSTGPETLSSEFPCNIDWIETTISIIVCVLEDFNIAQNLMVKITVHTAGVDVEAYTPMTNLMKSPTPIFDDHIQWFNTFISSYECSGSCTDLVLPTSLPVEIMLFGSNFGSSNDLTIVYAQPNGWETCSNPVVVNSTALKCNTKTGGTGVLNAVKVTFSNFPKISPNITISYPDLPQVIRASGCFPYAEASESFKAVHPANANSTYACPTEGGTEISLVLSKPLPGLVKSISAVRFGPYSCTGPVFDGLREINCTLQAGLGSTLDIEILGEIDSVPQSLSANSSNLLSYAGPSISSVVGCNSTVTKILSDNKTHELPADCDRSGGDIITITGANFGSQGSLLVLVGGVSCLSPPERDPFLPHSVVTCILPEHSGGSFSLFLSVQDQLADETDFTVDYSPCEDGYSEPLCLPCAVNEYSINGASCRECSSGKYAESIASFECTSCPLGRYRNSGFNSSEPCALCAPGTFSSTPGASTCIQCGEGSVSEAGATSCTFCEAGYQVESNECIPCSNGTASLFPGDSCHEAPPGKYVDLPASVTYSLCDPGKYQPSTGQAFCLDCSPGSYSFSGSPECVVCASGKYQDLGGQSTCIDCSPGKFQGNTGQSSCEICEENTFAQIYGAESCDTCEIGKFSGSASSFCLPCAVGTYSPDIGQGCIDCPIGRFSDDVGSSICEVCPIGKFSTETGSSDCNSCAPGRYSKDGVCIDCDIGTYQPDAGQTECLLAPKGAYVGSPGSNRFELCEANTYSEIEGAVQCARCAGAPLSTEVGRQTCDICSAGKYAPLVYRANNWDIVGSICLECPDGIDCDTPGYAFAKEGWWMSIDENQESETYGYISTYKCLPGRCFEASTCFANGMIDALPGQGNQTFITTSIQNATSTTYNMTTTTSTTSQNISTQTVPLFTSSDVSSQKNQDIMPGQSLACCGVKVNFKGESLDSHRGSFFTNPMCGGCAEGYYEWGTDCVACDNGVNWGAISVLLLVTFGMLYVFHLLSQITRAEIKIFFYFIQMVLLFFDSSTPWIKWLSFLSFDAVDSVNGVCLAPLKPKQKLMISLWVPFLAVAELGVVFLVSYLYWVLVHGGHTARWDRYKFRKSPFIRTVVALFLFVYYNITITVFEFFKCRDTGNGVQVVETYPGLVCGSDEYNSMKPIIYTFLILATIMSPFLITYFLYTNKHRLGNAKFLERYGTLYETYSKSSYYWEFVCLVRRTFLIAFAVSLSENDYSVRMVVLSLANLAILIHHLYQRPFSKSFDNGLETFSLAILLFISVRLINVDLPLSSNMSVLFIFLVMSPLALFFILYLAMRIFAFGYPDEYSNFMRSELMAVTESFLQKDTVIFRMEAVEHVEQESESVSSIDEHLALDPW